MADLASGDLRESLAALRDLLIERILAAEPKETAPLARQLSETLKALAGLPDSEKSPLDELAAKRARRHASSQKRARSGDKRRRGSGGVGETGGAGS